MMRTGEYGHLDGTLDGLWFFVERSYRKNPTSTQKIVERAWTTACAAWPDRLVSEVTPYDLAALHAKLTDERGPISANGTAYMVSAIFRRAHKAGWATHPSLISATVINQPTRRGRFLQPEQLRQIWKASEDYKQPGTREVAASAVQFGVLTGWRHDEVRTLRQDAIHPHLKAAHLTHTKTGEQWRPLSEGALRFLPALSWWGTCVHAFPGRTLRKPIGDLWPHWDRIRKAAGFPVLRFHELRHSWASTAVMAGRTLEQTAKATGHTTAYMASRYAHLSMSTGQRTAEVVAEQLGLFRDGGAE